MRRQAKYRSALPGISGVILILAFCVVILPIVGCSHSSSTEQTTASSQAGNNGGQYYSPLTGLPVASAADLTKPVTALMIDNLSAARPQSGIKDAEVVFEALAEGGITRFVAIYQQNKPQLIGPIRSVRPYYIDWAAAFDCSIGHVGGSAQALQQIRNGSYRDIDQFFNSKYYWRSSDRSAPHNVYTSFKKLDTLNKSKGYLTSHPAEFSRVNESPVANPDATHVSVRISSNAAYNSTYTYDKATNTYARYQGGTPYVDREKGQVKPSVVVVMMVEERTVLESGTDNEQIRTVGQGPAHIFQNGTVIQGTWHKTGLTSQITFVGTDGKDVGLVRGQTWIVAVSSSDGGVAWR